MRREGGGKDRGEEFQPLESWKSGKEGRVGVGVGSYNYHPANADHC